MWRPLQDGQTPRPLQEKATTNPWPQPVQRARAKPKQAWFAKFLELSNGIPSHDTFGRVFAMLDTTEFYACLQKWLATFNHTLADRGVQLDGDLPP